MHPQMIIKAAILVVLVALATSQDCSYDDREGYIIEIHNSEKSGAIFMSDVNTPTRESCQSACCDAEEEMLDDGSTARCNLAVYHNRSRGMKSKNCFLVFCPTETSCQLTPVKGFTSSFVSEIWVQDTTQQEALANRPPNPKFYLPDQPVTFHKIFRRSNSGKKDESDAAEKQAETVLGAAKGLLDANANAKLAGNDKNKQMVVEEEKLLSKIAVDALQSMEKRSKGAKQHVPYFTTPVMGSSEQPQKTTARPTTSEVKITSQRPTTSEQASTYTSQTDSPTRKATSLKPTEGTPTTSQTSTKMQESTKPVTLSHRPTTTATNPATSPLLAKSTPSGNKTPLVLTTGSTPSKTLEPTSLPLSEGTSPHIVTVPTSPKISSLAITNSKAPTRPTTSPSTKPPLGSTEDQSATTTTQSLGTSTTTEPSTQGDLQTWSYTATPSLQKYANTPNDLSSPNQLTSPPATSRSARTMHDMSSLSASQSSSQPPPNHQSGPAHHPSSSTVLTQSFPTPTAASLLTPTNQSHTESDVSLSTGHGTETTQSSTRLPENASTLPPDTKDSTPSQDATSPLKTSQPLIPVSNALIGNESSSSIIQLNDTDSSNDKATDLDPEDEQDPSTDSVIASNGALIAAVCFGVIFLLAVMVVLSKHWYEAYQRRHYSKVDYLINGMYN